MASPIFCCGFECGLIGPTGSHWGISGSGITVSTTTVRSGLRSARLVPNSAACKLLAQLPSQTSASQNVVRFYLNFAVLPTLSDCLIMAGSSSGLLGVWFKISTGEIVAGRAGTLGTTGVTVVVNTWYLIDCYVDNVNGTADVQVNGVACSQSGVQAAETFQSIYFGNLNGNGGVADYYIDDVLVSQTPADYPLGVGKVLGFVPNADGVHTSTTTTIVKGTIATPVGAAIVAGTTDAFNWVNARPVLGGATDNTRLINQQAISTTQYAEVAFEDTTETVPPRNVIVISAERQQTTAAGTFATKINDNGTEAIIINRAAAAGVITDRYATKNYAVSPSGVAWNLNASGNGSFQNIRARFGYSGDATPNQYWRGIMIEAEFAPAVVTSSKRLGLLGVG